MGYIEWAGEGCFSGLLSGAITECPKLDYFQEKELTA